MCATLWGRALASATVEPRGFVSPAWLDRLGRDLVLNGEHLSVLSVRAGALVLRRASSWDVFGREEWHYRAQLPTPTGEETALMPAAGVVSVLWAERPSRPWRGVGPLEQAGASATGLAAVEKALAQEASTRVGFVLPVPQGGGSAGVEKLREDIGTLKGGLSLVETTTAGWGEGQHAAPQRDWQASRLGPNPPEGELGYRRDVAVDVAQACGVPAALVDRGADGPTPCSAGRGRRRSSWPSGLASRMLCRRQGSASKHSSQEQSGWPRTGGHAKHAHNF